MSATINMEETVGNFVKVRDRLKEIDAAHEEKRKVYTEVLAQLQGLMQAFLDDTHQESAKTEAGTAYKSTRFSASLPDPEAFMRFVIDNNAFELLDRKANGTAVKDYVQKNNQPPPGCNLNAVTTVGVRRSS